MNITLGSDIMAPPIDQSTGRAGTAPGAAAGPESPAALQAGVLASADGARVLTDRVDIQPLDLAGALRILIAAVRADLAEATLGVTAEPAATAGPTVVAEAARFAAQPANIPGTFQLANIPDVAQSAVATPTVPQEALAAIEKTPADLAGIPADLPRAAMVLELPAEGSIPSLTPAPAPSLVQAAPLLMQLFLRALPEASPSPSPSPAAWLIAATRIQASLELALDKAVEAVAAWRDVPAAAVEGAVATRAAVLAALADDPQNPLWLRPEWVGLGPRMEWFWRRHRFARRALSDPDLYPHWPLEGDERREDGDLADDQPEER